MKQGDFHRRLGAVVRTRRRDFGWSQEELAGRVGVHRTYLGAVERGERNVSLNNLLHLASALCCPLSQLISDAERDDGGEHL